MATLDVLGFDETTGHEKIWTTGDIINGATNYWQRNSGVLSPLTATDAVEVSHRLKGGDNAGHLSIDTNARQLYQWDGANDLLALDWGALNTSAPFSIDAITAKTMFVGYTVDNSSVNAANFSGRSLYDGGGVISEDWGSRFLYDLSGFLSVDYGNRNLWSPGASFLMLDYSNTGYNGGAAISFNSQAAIFTNAIKDGSANDSINTNTRLLIGSDGAYQAIDFTGAFNSGATLSFYIGNAVFSTPLLDISLKTTIDLSLRTLSDENGIPNVAWNTSSALRSFFVDGASNANAIYITGTDPNTSSSLMTAEFINRADGVAAKFYHAHIGTIVNLSSSNNAIYATDSGGRTVTIADGTYAISTVGTSLFTYDNAMTNGRVVINDNAGSGYQLFVQGDSGTSIPAAFFVDYSNSNSVEMMTGDGLYALHATGAINADGTITTPGGNVIGANFSQTIQAQTDGDSLAGVSISPTFDDNTHTGLTKYALRVSGNGQFFGAAGENVAIANEGTAINATGGNVGGISGGVAGGFTDYNFVFNAALASNDGSDNGFAGYFLDGNGNQVTISNRTYALDILGPINTDQAGSSPGLAGGVPTFTDYYGGNTNALGDPQGWLTIFVAGNERRIPFYAAP